MNNGKQTVMGVPLERREITDKTEADVIRGENEEQYAKLKEEQKSELDSTLKPDWGDKDAEDPSPPRTYEQFYKLVRSAFPFDTPIKFVESETRRLVARQPFIERAIRDGLAKGRELREAESYGHGWWWDSLGSLTPFERTQVLRVIKSAIHK